MTRRFADRAAAGRQLGAAVAARLGDAAGSAVVLGLPRGGVVVAAPVAARLGCPLGVVAVRKLGLPHHAELAMGAVAVWGEHAAVTRNEHVVARAGVPESVFADVRDRELAAARDRATQWGGRPPPVAGRVVVLVDDGLATGATLRAAADALRTAAPARLLAAIPVGPAAELPVLAQHVDDVVCLLAPGDFVAVGAYYADFGQADDATVAAELDAAARRLG